MNVEQDAFARALLAPEAAVPPGLSDPNGRPAGKRFDVYRNNVMASLTDALTTAFPVIHKLVGAANFKVLAAAFVRKHPPQTPLIMHYGAEMPSFLETFEPARSLGYLPDIARLEQAMRTAYHAADAQAIDPAWLAQVPPDALMTLRLALAPAVQVLRSPWPIHSIWSYNMVANSPKPEARAEDIAVLRPGFDPEPHLLAPGVAAFLTALHEGVALGTANARAGAEAADFDLAQALSLLLSTNSLTHLEGQP